MSDLILYHQPECHLCDEAETLLLACGLADRFRRVDIESDLELLKRYGFVVPVLRCAATRQELLWPFDRQQVEAFLQVAP